MNIDTHDNNQSLNEPLLSARSARAPNCPLLDIPVSEGRTGLITLDGLNPISALHEAGIPVEFAPLSGLEDISAYAAFEDIAPMGRRSVYVE